VCDRRSDCHKNSETFELRVICPYVGTFAPCSTARKKWGLLLTIVMPKRSMKAGLLLKLAVCFALQLLMDGRTDGRRAEGRTHASTPCYVLAVYCHIIPR